MFPGTIRISIQATVTPYVFVLGEHSVESGIEIVRWTRKVIWDRIGRTVQRLLWQSLHELGLGLCGFKLFDILHRSQRLNFCAHSGADVSLDSRISLSYTMKRLRSPTGVENILSGSFERI